VRSTRDLQEVDVRLRCDAGFADAIERNLTGEEFTLLQTIQTAGCRCVVELELTDFDFAHARRRGPRRRATPSTLLSGSGVTWTADHQDSACVADPRKLVPNGKIKYGSLPDAVARDDIVACLAAGSVYGKKP